MPHLENSILSSELPDPTTSSKDHFYDWFKSPEELLPFLEPIFPSHQSPILILGCGNSKLSETLYCQGYKNITNVDYSANIIHYMKAFYESLGSFSTMKWFVMDVRNMNELPSQSYDIIIDKGTLDVFLCGKDEDVWDPSSKARDDVNQELDQVNRLLSKNGSFIYITFGQPHFRRPLLERPDIWDVHVKNIGLDGFCYFMYILTKK